MSLQLEMVSCSDCRKCQAGGRVHGPYWYRYFRRDGKMVSEYVGKNIPAKDATKEMPEGSTPEDLYPERVKEMRAKAERDAAAKMAALTPQQDALLDSIVRMKTDAQKAYRRSRKQDADDVQRAAATDERRRLKERARKEKAKLREMLAGGTHSERSRTQEADSEAVA